MPRKQYAVIGLGTFGFNVARELAKNDIQVLAIDQDEELINDISPYVAHAVSLDATDDQALKDVGITDCEVAIVAIGESMETSILVTLILKELGIRTIIVKSTSPWHSRIAAKIGANRIIYPEYEMARKLAESLAKPNILEEIEVSPDYNMVEIVAPKRFWGKTILESGIRANFRISIIAIKRPTPVITEEGEVDITQEINIAPGAEDEIRENDILILVGRNSDVERLKSI